MAILALRKLTDISAMSRSSRANGIWSLQRPTLYE